MQFLSQNNVRSHEKKMSITLTTELHGLSDQEYDA